MGAGQVRWESELGVYTVLEQPCHYYRLRRFYRQRDGAWEAAPALAGPWSPVPASELPPALARLGPCTK